MGMSKHYLKWLLGRCLAPFILLFVRLAIRAIYKRVSVGTCEFWGNQSQCDDFEKGLAYLSEIDPDMFRRVTTELPLLFYYDKKTNVEADGMFTVPQPYFVWDKKGVVTRVVHCYFLRHRLGRKYYPTVERGNRLDTLNRDVLLWLTQHEFPKELCDSVIERPSIASKNNEPQR
jgi:hypothetical protein